MGVTVGRSKDLSLTEAAGWTLTGFGAGLLAGALMAGWVGAGGTVRVRRAWQGWRAGRHAKPTTAATAARAQAALDQSGLREYQLRVIGVGPASIELHGWVPTRRIRALAARVASEAHGVNHLTNAILVRGEDDRSQPRTSEDQSA